MTLPDHKKHYSRFLNGHEGRLHFAAHSHHFWPDVTRGAHLEYWDDCALMSDQKWNKIFGEVIPKTQGHIAAILNLSDKNQIALAPNTHELASRILSLFVGRPKLSVLTTSSEFHSWRRQILRLSELPEVDLKVLSTDSFLDDRRDLIENLKLELKKGPDLFFLSQVFFDSGLAFTDEELLELATECPTKTVMVIDGYHGFAALPTDLSKLEGKIFYLAGGYKYGQGGEGVGLLVVPKGTWRPAYTGWFAEYGELSRPPGTQVGYTENGMAFMGATQDPSGFYRFNATWDLFKNEGLDAKSIHAYVTTLQKEFLKLLPEQFLKRHALKALFPSELKWHGHFLTFEARTEGQAQDLETALKKLAIVIDRRGKRLRFGFGLYQNLTDVRALTDRLKNWAISCP